MHRLLRMLALAAAPMLATAACTGDNADDAGDADRGIGAAAPDAQIDAGEPGGTLTVYARDRDIAEPLFEQFEQQTGMEIQARWGDPIQLADQIIDDGDGSPADVYFGPLSDALGTLDAAGRLAPLTSEQLGRVPDAYRSPDGTWAATSGRAHVVFYNGDEISEDDLPDSILGFTDPAWRGRIGWDPTSRSLRDVVTELRQLDGEDTARTWLEGIQANEPGVFQGADAIIDAVAAGEIIDVGFGSHSYLPDRQADGEATNVAARFYPAGAPGGLLNVAGVGIIESTDDLAGANAFVDFMLSPAAQEYYATDAYEIPLTDDVTLPSGTPTASELAVPGLDIRQFDELDDARRLLTEVGITR